MSPAEIEQEARKKALLALGKTLARRADSRCELCNVGGRLGVLPVGGGPPEPSIDWAILACVDCVGDIEGRGPGDLDRLKFLRVAVWSDVRPVQIVASRMCRKLSSDGVDWATDLLDNVWDDDEVTGVLAMPGYSQKS
jgi:protein PhnA